MSEENPTFEPDAITVGETLEWTKSLPDYPASEGWTLTYYFRGAGPGFDAIAAPDRDDYTITVPTSDTANMTPGKYFWEAWATKGSEKHLVDEGRSLCKQSFLNISASTAVDDRTQAEKDLAAVRAALVGNLDAFEYQIQVGASVRQLRRFTKAELLELKNDLVRTVNAERRRARVRQGGSFIENVKVGFDRPQ